jgi:hypothetical protein
VIRLTATKRAFAVESCGRGSLLRVVNQTRRVSRRVRDLTRIGVFKAEASAVAVLEVHDLSIDEPDRDATFDPATRDYPAH